MAFQERVIREFDDLRQAGDRRIRVRLVQSLKAGERHLDIREYVQSTKFTGFTKRGIRLALEEIDALGTLIPSIQKLLAGTGRVQLRTPRNRQRVPKASSCR